MWNNLSSFPVVYTSTVDNSGTEHMSGILDPTSLLLFCTANFLVLIVPGPAVMYTITRSLDQGKTAGLLSVYGLAIGTLPHALAVAFGVAGLLAVVALLACYDFWQSLSHKKKKGNSG